MNLPGRDRYLRLSDAELSACCTLDFYLGSGPGGQHRNKNATGVRLIFPPLGIQVSDDTGRSQHRNRKLALRKLRLQIALRCREAPPEQPWMYQHLREDNPEYPLAVAWLFDVLAEAGYDHKPAAGRLGLSNSGLLKELGREQELWRVFAAAREERALPTLKRP